MRVFIRETELQSDRELETDVIARSTLFAGKNHRSIDRSYEKNLFEISNDSRNEMSNFKILSVCLSFRPLFIE